MNAFFKVFNFQNNGLNQMVEEGGHMNLSYNVCCWKFRSSRQVQNNFTERQPPRNLSKMSYCTDTTITVIVNLNSITSWLRLLTLITSSVSWIVFTYHVGVSNGIDAEDVQLHDINNRLT